MTLTGVEGGGVVLLYGNPSQRLIAHLLGFPRARYKNTGVRIEPFTPFFLGVHLQEMVP